MDAPPERELAGANAGLEKEREGEVLLRREVADIKVGDQAAVEGRELDIGRWRTAEERERDSSLNTSRAWSVISGALRKQEM